MRVMGRRSQTGPPEEIPDVEVEPGNMDVEEEEDLEEPEEEEFVE